LTDRVRRVRVLINDWDTKKSGGKGRWNTLPVKTTHVCEPQKGKTQRINVTRVQGQINSFSNENNVSGRTGGRNKEKLK